MSRTPDDTRLSKDALRTRWSMLDQLEGSRADDSWEWFIGRYRDFVVGALRGILRDHEAAHGAADDFWSYLFEQRACSAADRERRFRAYLAGTVRNFAREWRRRQTRARGLPLDASAEPEVLPEDVELRLWAHTVLTLCLRTMHQRHPEQARALCWFYGVPMHPEDTGGAMAATEIARRLGIAPATVHQMLSRGRRRLREIVEDELRETVHSSAELEDEVALLVSAVSESNPGLLA